MDNRIRTILGPGGDDLLNHRCQTIPKEMLHLPRPTFIDEVRVPDRSVAPRSAEPAGGIRARPAGRDRLPVHSAGGPGGRTLRRFCVRAQPDLLRSGEHRQAGRRGTLQRRGFDAGCARCGLPEVRHKIPFIVKINHNELLSYPNTYDQRLFGSVEQAFDLGGVAVGATIYYGSEESRRQIEEISAAFEQAHQLGMFTVVWAYLRNEHFTKDGVNYETAADLTGQANHLAATIEADLVKQKQPTNNGGFKVLNFGKTHPDMYQKLTSDHPIDLTRYQVANCYMGRVPLINSGGASGKNDLQQAVRTAVINKRAGGTGLITGRKAFQKPMNEGVELLHAVQDVYLDKDITVA